MYTSNINTRDKGGAIVAVVLVHVALLFVLLHLSGRMDLRPPDSVMRVFDVRSVPPPPPEPVQPPQPQPKPKEAQSPASPRNVRSKATDVQAPKPPFSLPVPVPMATTTTPASGSQATEGASNAGPGTGAGGTGNGTGSGGAGNGSGGGGGYVTSPRLLTPVLRGRDFARELLDSWPRGAELFLRIRVAPNGSVAQCIVDRGTGVPGIDSTVCEMVQQRFRYSPAVDRNGQAVAGWAGYRQVAPR